MNKAHVTRLEIISNLAFVPSNNLEEIKNFVDFILFKNKAKARKPISVRGIWKDKGFEKIDIEKEIKTLRKEIQFNLDRKEII